jgi:hypothetical protein
MLYLSWEGSNKAYLSKKMEPKFLKADWFTQPQYY